MNIQDFLGRLARGAVNGVASIPEKLMPTPPYVEGLLSKEDVGGARRMGLLSLGASLLSPGSSASDAFQAAQGAYGSQMGNTMQMRQVAEQRAGEQRKAQVLAELRKKYPTMPKTPEEARQMVIDFAMAGIPLEGGVSEVVKSWQDEDPKPVTVSPGATLVDPQTGKVIYQAPHTPRDPSVRSGVEDQRLFNRENTLATAFGRETTPLRELHAIVLTPALRTAAAAKQGNGPAQVELLYSFVRALDPNSVVREGEVALIQRARSIRQRAEGLIAKATRGEAVVVPSSMVDEMAALIEERTRNIERYVGDRQKYYESRARRAGSDPEGLFEGLTPVPDFGGGAFGDVRSGSSGASKVRSTLRGNR